MSQTDVCLWQHHVAWANIVSILEFAPHQPSTTLILWEVQIRLSNLLKNGSSYAELVHGAGKDTGLSFYLKHFPVYWN